MQHRLFYHAIINGSAPQYLIDDLPGHICDQTRYNLRNKDDTNFTTAKQISYEFFSPKYY